MPKPVYLLAPVAAVMLSGCLAKAALDVATAPVRIAGKAADVATTSQSERDEQRGRELRKREERYGKLAREYSDQIDACGDGKMSACDKADDTRTEMDELRRSIPASR